jgi:hypothetical protein
MAECQITVLPGLGQKRIAWGQMVESGNANASPAMRAHFLTMTKSLEAWVEARPTGFWPTTLPDEVSDNGYFDAAYFDYDSKY